MKILIISDIHGISKNLKKVLDIYNKEKCNFIFCLGDLFSPGWDSEEVEDLLNSKASNIICMKGNNDTYIYGRLYFNLVDGYLKQNVDNHNFYLTHGHRYNRDIHPFLNDGDILVYGHTHRGMLLKENNKYYINPGSLSLPRDGTDGSYIIYENNRFNLYDIDNNLIDSLLIEGD
ncbi:MAG: phosphodiesterase [Bacilli bacterium]|nr:phosphodiesterase [Bacilli bacterium]